MAKCGRFFPGCGCAQSGLQSEKPSALQRFERCGRAGAQKAHVATDREEAHATLGERDRALDGMAIGTHDFAGLLRRARDAVELAVDVERHGIDIGAVAERDRKTSAGPRKSASMPGVAAIASTF